MQRKAMVALVAGASLGVGAGALGAFVAWAAAGAAARRFHDQFGDQDIELEQPAPSATWHSAQQASSGSAPVTSPASAPSLPRPKEAVTAAQAP